MFQGKPRPEAEMLTSYLWCSVYYTHGPNTGTVLDVGYQKDSV